MTSLLNKEVDLNIVSFVSIFLLTIFSIVTVNQRPANVIVMNNDGKDEENVESPNRPLRFPYNYYNSLVRSPYERISNVLLPPFRSHNAINVPTRGEPGEFQQVGILSPALEVSTTPLPGSNVAPRILPLYGRRTYNGSDKWHYYISTDGYQSVKIPITSNSRGCMDTNGCTELYNNDVIHIPIYNQDFKASLYNYDYPRYIPHL